MATCLLSSCCDVNSLKAHEDEVVDALLSCDLGTLSREAAKIGVIPVAVKKSLDSMDPRVPHQDKLRYLLLQAYRQLEANSKLVEHWVKVVVKHGVSKALFGRACKPVAKGENTMSKAEFYFSEEHVSVLTEILANYGSEWRSMSIWLNLPRGVRKSISARLHMLNDGDCMCEVLEEWILGGHEHAKAPTLGNLKKALGSKTVGLYSEAHELEDNLLKHGVCFVDPASLSITEDGAVDKPKPNTPSIKIVSQSVEAFVAEEKSTLLEVQAVSTCGGTVSYQWLKDGSPLTDCDGHYLGSNKNILCVKGVLSCKGVYHCKLMHAQCESVCTSELAINLELSQPTKLLVDKYCATQPPDSMDDHQWPPPQVKTCINLALVEHERINKLYYYTVQGDMDDIVYKKKEITYKDVFQKHRDDCLFLIEGRPGSGKTTLVRKIAKDWAKGMPILQCAKWVFLVPLRILPKNASVLKSILELFYTDAKDRVCAEEHITKTNGKGICFIFDGLDEYYDADANKKIMNSSIIFQIMRRKCLQRSMVIVSSRPNATHYPRHRAHLCIEVVGFQRQEILEYIREYPFSYVHAKELELYLNRHPNVMRMCYLPVHSVMVCFLYDIMKDDLPHTESEIYKYFTLSTLRRKNEQFDSLDKLPDDYKTIFMRICKVAFDMTVSRKQIFEPTEFSLFEGCPNVTDPSLGLITIDHTAWLCGYKKLYSFVHLTFQEFLAAYHISRLGEQEQAEIICEHGRKRHMQVVWKFFCGLAHFGQDTGKFKLILKQHPEYYSLFQCQCAFESQQPDTCEVIAQFGKGELVFREHVVNSADFTPIKYVISNSQLRSLSLRHCIGSQSSNKDLLECCADVLKLCSSLQKLDLGCNGIGEKGASILADGLEECKELIYFNLSQNAVKDSGIKYITRRLRCTDVEKLHLQCNQIGDIGCQALAQFLKQCPKLSVLHLENNQISDKGARYLGEGLTDCSKLTEVHLDHNRISNEGVGVLAESLTPCEMIRLEHNEIGNEGAKSFANSLKWCYQLSKLHLDHNQIGDEGARGLGDGLKQCSSLFWLRLDHNEISDEGAKGLAEGLKYCGRLSRLHLEHNKIGSAGVNVLAVGIRQCGNLSWLFLGNNHIGDDAKGLVGGMPRCTKLHLEHNNIGDESAKELAEGLKLCQQLSYLHFNNNKISDDGVIGLANSLVLMHTSLSAESKSVLYRIYLERNKIGDKGAIGLGYCLKHCKNLSVLCLDHNQISHEGAKGLADGLEHCKRLCRFTVSHNKLGNRGVENLACILLHCKGLGRLNLSHNEISDEGVTALADYLRKCTIDEGDTASTNKKCTVEGDTTSANSQKCIVEGDTASATNSLRKCIDEGVSAANTDHLYDIKTLILAKRLKEHTGDFISELRLDHNCFGDQGAMSLGEALRKCKNLVEIYLNHNLIGDEGVESLAAGFRHCKYLSEIHLEHNRIGDDGIRSLVGDYLKGCFERMQFHLRKNVFGEERSEDDSIKDDCPNLTEVHLHDNSFREEGLKCLEELKVFKTPCLLNLENDEYL